jgi:hypothetical protein
MSTSLRYPAFGIRGYRYTRTDYLQGEVVFTIEQRRATLQCPLCGSHPSWPTIGRPSTRS